MVNTKEDYLIGLNQIFKFTQKKISILHFFKGDVRDKEFLNEVF